MAGNELKLAVWAHLVVGTGHCEKKGGGRERERESRWGAHGGVKWSMWSSSAASNRC